MAIEVHRLRAARGSFERVPNEASYNIELSLMAVGLLTRLLADGANYSSIDAIADAYSPPVPAGRKRQKQGFGRDAYRFAAQELEAAGHLVRTRTIFNGVPARRIEVFAEPYGNNVHSVPTPLVASSSGPAETPRKPRSARTPLLTSSVPPAETVHKPRSRQTPLVTSSFLTDVSPDVQTSSPYPLNGHDQEREPQEDGGGVDDSRQEPATRDQTAANALVAALPINISAIDQRRRRQLCAGIIDALAAGWTDADLKQELLRDLGSARSPIGVWLSRLKPENLRSPNVEPEPISGACLRAEAIRACRWCDDYGDWYRNATDTTGIRCTHPDGPPAGHPAHHAATEGVPA